ncbi:MAG: hypothetical protein LBI62_10400 [Candidatus Accumulibacter sp.]|jgi:hypothetical protein|nr:hypothetical protein [Accumulibacter sp.]
MKPMRALCSLMILCLAALAFFPPDATAAISPEEREKVLKLLQLGVQKMKEKAGQVQQAAQANVAEALGRQADCQAFAEALVGRRDEFVLLAALSAAIYRRPEGQRKRLPDAPESLDIVEAGKNITLWFDPVSDGYAEVHHDALPGTEVIIFRGTQLKNIQDLSTNLRQFVNIVPERYQWAAALAARVARDAPRTRILMTGHSLGGGLATYAALSHGAEAVVFNPAGLSQGAQAVLPATALDAGKRQVVTFIARGGEALDPVSALSLAGESWVAGRRYLVEREASLTHLQIHRMDGLAQVIEDAAEPLVRCGTDLGFQDTAGLGTQLVASSVDAPAQTAVQRNCRTMQVKTKGGVNTQTYCRTDNGEWVLAENLPPEPRAAATPQTTASPAPAAAKPEPEPQKMSLMPDGRKVYVAFDSYAGTYEGETILENGILKAHGKGVAQGFYRYEGKFRQGRLHGYGVASWTKDDRNVLGNKFDDFRKHMGNLREEGGRYILSGWWENDGLLFRCNTEMSKAACQNEDTSMKLGRAAKVAKELWNRKKQSGPRMENFGDDSPRNCSHLYVGKAVNIQTCKTTLILQRKKCTDYRGVITGMNAANGVATVMVRGNNTVDDGKMVNLPCSYIR